jgi:hypothetical protein
MAQFPEPPRNQISYVDADRDQQPEVLRDDHHDHDLAFARAKYAELQPAKPQQVKLPRWMVLTLFMFVILFILMFASTTFTQLGK